MKIWTESVLITDLKVGDYLIEGNEILEADIREIETLEHRDGSSGINGSEVSHWTRGIMATVHKWVHVVRWDFYQEVADRWGCSSRKEAKELFLVTGRNIMSHQNKKEAK
jgi:hypothetical protein